MVLRVQTAAETGDGGLWGAAPTCCLATLDVLDVQHAAPLCHSHWQAVIFICVEERRLRVSIIVNFLHALLTNKCASSMTPDSQIALSSEYLSSHLAVWLIDIFHSCACINVII
jgi:hypothetical protein